MIYKLTSISFSISASEIGSEMLCDNGSVHLQPLSLHWPEPGPGIINWLQCVYEGMPLHPRQARSDSLLIPLITPILRHNQDYIRLKSELLQTTRTPHNLA